MLSAINITELRHYALESGISVVLRLLHFWEKIFRQLLMNDCNIEIHLKDEY